MGFLDKLLVGGLAVLIGSVFRDAQETKRRKNSPLRFDSRLSAQEFADIASRIARKTPRVVWVDTTGMAVTLAVRSNIGLPKWTSTITDDSQEPTG